MAGSATGDQTSGLLGAFHDTRILEVLDSNQVYAQLADKRPIAVRSGTTITFHTISKLGRGSNLTQGVQPAAQFMTAGTRTATLTQFGDVTAIADVMAKAGVADLMMLAAERFGEAASITVDEYIQDRIFSTSAIDVASKIYYHTGPLGTKDYNNNLSVWYDGKAGGCSAYMMSAGTRTKVTTAQVLALSTYESSSIQTDAIGGAMKLTLKQIRRVVTTLRAANVKGFSNNEYALVARPEAIEGLMNDPEWTEWNRYNNADKMFSMEIGKVESCKIIQSTNQMKFNFELHANLTAYLNTFLGSQCFAITEFSGDTGIHMYEVPFSNKDSGNVLQQNAYIGWKWTGVAAVLDETQGVGLITING